MVCPAGNGAATAAVPARAVNPQHRLLVMHQQGILVAVPLMLDSHFATPQDAKTAIVHEVQQLAEFVSSMRRPGLNRDS